MDERTCETCIHEEKTNGMIPCNGCKDGSGWEPKYAERHETEGGKRR